MGPTSSIPDCQAPYDTNIADYKQDLNAPQPTCGCTCDPPTGVQCSTPTITFYSDGACNNPCGTTNQAVGAACGAYAFGTCPNNAKGKLNATSVPSGGSCMPRPATTIPPTTWGTTVRLCLANTALPVCANGDTCMPAPGLNQTTGAWCVAATGTLDCPAGYPMKQVGFSGVTDSRGCTTCSCDGVDGGTCGAATVTGYDNSQTCGGNATHTLTQGAACAPPGDSAMITTPGVATGGGCNPSPVQPDGGATAANPTTICCTR